MLLVLYIILNFPLTCRDTIGLKTQVAFEYN
jgi:hypothetical protein